MRWTRPLGALALAAALATPALADPVRLGFIAALSGPFGAIGADQRRGLDLALEHLGGRIGGQPVEIAAADSRGVPATAVQEASRLIERDRVQIVTGGTASNEIMAMVPPITRAGRIFLGSNGGPSPLAGAECNENYFSVAFQNDEWSAGMGAYMAQAGVRRAYLIGMDYQAGRDHLAGARRGFAGEVVAEVYTPQAQMDFAAELAQIRAARPDGVFAFYPGAAAVAFVKQYAQSGLGRTIPLFSNPGLSDPLLFAAQGEAAVGIVISGSYASEADNPQNRRFVADFRARHGRDPSTFAAQQYDALILLDAAVREAGGVDDIAKLRAALRRADFRSVRGEFRFNRNQMPLQRTLIQRVDRRADGLFLAPVATLPAQPDPFVALCRMTW
jgi:branched-chain amino acid transport system substrate-binding protein